MKIFAVIRSKGDQALFRLSTTTLKRKMKVPANRPLADFLPTISIKAKELALKHRNKIILTDAPTGVENVQTILEAIDQKRGIECDYYSYKNNTLKEHLLIPYFLRTWENRWYLNSCCGTGRNWRSWNRKAFGRR